MQGFAGGCISSRSMHGMVSMVACQFSCRDSACACCELLQHTCTQATCTAMTQQPQVVVLDLYRAGKETTAINRVPGLVPCGHTW